VAHSSRKRYRVNTSNFDKDTKIQATKVIQKLKLSNIIESPKDKDSKQEGKQMSQNGGRRD